MAKPDLTDMAFGCSLLSDQTRLGILKLLTAGPKNVTALCRRLGLKQPTISHHLGLLRMGRLVIGTRAGKSVIYTVDAGGVDNLNTARLPVFARVDVRTTFRPGGGSGRWELYVDVINVLNRKNAGAIRAQLEYDPTSDRPRLVETRGAAIPLLPSFGMRVRF